MPRFIFLLFLCVFLLCNENVTGQNAQDKALPITVNISNAPASITLNWPAGPDGSVFTLRKRIKGVPTWATVLSNSPNISYEDTDVSPGICYEYGVQRGGTTVPSTGYICAGIDVLPIEVRGIMILVVDQNLLSLEAGISRLQADIENDGWSVKRLDIDPAEETPASVKAKINTLYSADPDNTKALLLLGGIPVPYSGNICPDGHPEHCGAWPADVYYGDITGGTWTDISVNVPSSARPENRNIPGDGKFDQSTLSSTIELQVGRVDFTRLEPATFGVANRLVLYQRYLDKNHAFRFGQYKVEARALVDDNFGYFGGEAFAASGWRNGYALVGPNAVVSGDILTDTDNQSFLMIYGCGGGWYQGANGVGSTASFAADSIPAVFSMLFGSYHGDWDSSDNFMMGALANKGGILTCSWAGRPHWYYHHLTMGENIGYSARITQNNGLNSNYADAGFGGNQVHVALLGDPGIRAHYPTPPSGLSIEKQCFNNQITWIASADSTIIGYHIYRWSEGESVPSRLTQVPVIDTVFVDSDPQPKARYWVRALRLELTHAGTYYNLSTAIASDTVTRTPLLHIEVADTPADCAGNQLITPLPSGGVPPYHYQWSNGTMEETAVFPGGAGYVVILSDSLGCNIALQGTAEVIVPLVAQLFGTNETVTGAMDGAVLSQISGGTPPYSYHWSTGSSDSNLHWLSPGTYQLTVTDDFGCTTFAQIVISTTVGTTEAAQDKTLGVYPNPASAEMTIKTLQPTGYIEITDLLGRLQYITPATLGEKRIEVSHWSQGIYQIAWKDPSGAIITTKSIIVVSPK